MNGDQFNSSVIDVPGLMDHIDSDVSILIELIDIFNGYYPNQMEALRAALDSGDCSEIREIAHQFKGAISNFFGIKAVDVAKQLELCGRDGQLEDARAKFSQLEVEIDQLVNNLQQLAESCE